MDFVAKEIELETKPPTARHAPASDSDPAQSIEGSIPLPERPIVIIEPSRSWVALNLRDIWAYRELLYFLVWRDVKVRYKQTALGAAWAILQPLFMMLIFSLFFGRVAASQFRRNLPWRGLSPVPDPVLAR